MRNPTVYELKEFIKTKMNIPAEALDKVLEFIYGLKQRKLEEFINK